MWSLWLLYCDFYRVPRAARFAARTSFTFFEQVGGAIGLGEDFNIFELRAVAQAVVIEKTAYHEDPHFGALAAQIYGGIMTGQSLDIGARQEEVRLGVFEAIDGLPQVAGGEHGW